MSVTATNQPWIAQLGAVAVVWRRELVRYRRARGRMVAALIQPLIFLFVLGVGLNPLVGETDGVRFTTFVFPGILAMTIATHATMSAASIVWDREFGFLREMLVAPVSRTAIVTGKAAGGTSVALFQSLVLLALGPVVGLRVGPWVAVQVVGIGVVLGLALSGFGILLASVIERLESFQVVIQMAVFPLLFLSGALFPVHQLPPALFVIVRANPLTYGVDLLRRLLFGAQDYSPEALERFGVGVTLLGRQLSPAAELGMIALFGVVTFTIAIRRLSRPR